MADKGWQNSYRRRFAVVDFALGLGFAAGLRFTAGLVFVADAFVAFPFGTVLLITAFVFFNDGSFDFTAFVAVFAVFSVPEETSVFPCADRFPMIVPAMAPATAPRGPATTLPTIAPATPPAVCLETGKLAFAGGELFFFMVQSYQRGENFATALRMRPSDPHILWSPTSNRNHHSEVLKSRA